MTEKEELRLLREMEALVREAMEFRNNGTIMLAVRKEDDIKVVLKKLSDGRQQSG